MQGQELRSAVVTVVHCNRTRAGTRGSHARRPKDIPPSGPFGILFCVLRITAVVPMVEEEEEAHLHHHGSPCAPASVPAARQTSSSDHLLAARGSCPAMPCGYPSSSLACPARQQRCPRAILHLIHGVSVDCLHLSHLVRCQIQLLREKLNLAPSHSARTHSRSALSWTGLVLRWWRRRRRILCHRRQCTQRGRAYRQNSCSQHGTTKHRHLHRFLTLQSHLAGECLSGGQAYCY